MEAKWVLGKTCQPILAKTLIYVTPASIVNVSQMKTNDKIIQI